jgi:spermidine synthase
MEHPPDLAKPSQVRAQWPIAVILLTGFGLFCLGLLIQPSGDPWVGMAVGVGGALVIVAAVAVKKRRRWLPGLLADCEAHTDSLDALPQQAVGRWIALASGAALFVELMLVRWQASTFQLFAYYKNVTLLAGFLGLGIGYAYGRRRPVLTPLVLPALSVQFVALACLRLTDLQFQLQNPVSENLTLGMDSEGNLAQAAVSYGFLLLVFTATLLTCIPLGHLASRLMIRLPPLTAYSYNLLGSLAGIAAFTSLGFIWAPPTVWLLLAALAIIPFLTLGRTWSQAMPSVLYTAVALATLLLPFRVNQYEIYSPYQVLALRVERDGAPSLLVNQVYFQRVLNLSPEAIRSKPELQKSADYYELPYQLKPHPERVLVVGSGTGNDVAAGLRRQAGHIDAVEIDPAILALGRTIHPENPYADGRVDAIVQDARTFLRHTDRQYDLIVYGLLDSHTLLSGLSSVRLDSFVYTVEAFREARARLAPDGVLAMTFCVLSEQQGRKFYLMLREAFDGQEPRAFLSRYDNGITFVVGPGVPAGAMTLPIPEATAAFRNDGIPADVSTDDWPFLYMPVRKYPRSYVVMVAMLVVASLLVLYQLLPLEVFSPVCFFLGAGFMLVETKGITELGLVFGNTWHVMAVVIASILVMAYLANSCCARWGTLPPLAAYGLLLGALLLGMLGSGAALAGLPPLVGKPLAAGFITMPLFFSGFAFSGQLRLEANVPAALSSNLLGAMLGGFCEYNSMYFGFRSLYLFALVLYGLALVATLTLGRRWHAPEERSNTEAPGCTRALQR